MRNRAYNTYACSWVILTQSDVGWNNVADLDPGHTTVSEYGILKTLAGSLNFLNQEYKTSIIIKKGNI